jgi:hypothetical protein
MLVAIIESCSLALAVVAIVYAYFHTHKLDNVANNLDNVTKLNDRMSGNLTEIAKSLPTQNIGAFPDYVKRIADLINSATKEVIVVCDSPCYCAFSDRNLWAEYQGALFKAKERFVAKTLPSMSLAWMDAPCRKAVLKEQFDPPEKQNWKEGIEEKLKRFLESEASLHNYTADTVTYLQLEHLVERVHENFIQSMGSVPTIPVHVTLHLYFWIIDDEAVFAFPKYAEGGKGYAVWTRDPKIIEGLKAIHARLYDEQQSANPHAFSSHSH